VQPWIKFYEALTKPLPVASALFLFVSTSFLLASSDSILARLGLSHLVVTYQWAVGLGFVIALTWLAVTTLLWIGKALYQGISTKLGHYQAIRREKLRVKNAIPQMDSKEREIIGYLLAKNQRMFTNTPDGGYASTLVSKGIVVPALQPGQIFSYWEMPYEVPEHIWNVLLKHKAEFPYSGPRHGEIERHPWRIHWMAR
jgi:hypothetical protein